MDVVAYFLLLKSIGLTSMYVVQYIVECPITFWYVTYCMYSDQIQNGSNCFINELFVTFSIQ